MIPRDMWWLILALLVVSVVQVNCQRKTSFFEKPLPEDALVFRSHLIEGMKDTLAVTTCQCCGKSLLLCYEETLDSERKGCPDV